MQNIELIIERLNYFKDNKHDEKEFISFINGVSLLQEFYESKIISLEHYIKNHVELIDRFANQLPFVKYEEFDEREIAIIEDILHQKLHFFYVLHNIEKNEDINSYQNNIFRNLAINFYLDNKNKFSLNFFNNLATINTKIKEGMISDTVASKAPKIPAVFNPANVATLIPTGPGVIDASATICVNSSKLYHLKDSEI